MAPRVPEEIDVFTAPHSRMKELVSLYTRKMSCVDFRDVPEVVSLLQDLDTTLSEFKSHESIENIFIMDQLKNRLKQHQISNTAVCDCHNDNQLSDVVQLVRRGTQVRERSVGERITFGLQLQQAFQDFVNIFLPHMEEEEQVFQPMLVEYFEYDELKVLKEIVLKEHEMAKERRHVEKAQDLQEGRPETHSCVKDLRDLDWDLCSLTEPLDGHEAQEGEPGSPPPPLPLPPEQPHLPPDHIDPTQDLSTTTAYPSDLCHDFPPPTSYHAYSPYSHDHNTHPDYHTSHYLLPDYQYQQDIPFNDHTQHHVHSLDHTAPSLSPFSSSSASSIPALPIDVVVEIFRYLAPPDLCRCAQVCSSWNNAVFSPTLWSSLYPVQWARGIWERRDVGLCGALEDEAYQQQQQQQQLSRKWDEDADVDEAEEGEENPEAVWECRMMESLVWWVLPRVGAGVNTLVVDAGRGITSRLLHQALLLCPNLTFFSAAHSPVDSYTFKGLWLQGALQKLYHLDLQGCQLIDDLALQYLALCVGQGSSQNTMSLPAAPCPEELVYEGGCCRCGYSGPTWPNMPCQGRNRGNRNSQRPLGVHLNSSHIDIEEICPRGPGGWEVMIGDSVCRSSIQLSSSKPMLDSLNLSGCWRIRDKGLLAIGAAGGLLSLTFLDVSGCYQLTGQGLEAVARVCPTLSAEKLWYCNDILDGPLPTLVNGCANLANPVRMCCRSGQ